MKFLFKQFRFRYFFLVLGTIRKHWSLIRDFLEDAERRVCEAKRRVDILPFTVNTFTLEFRFCVCMYCEIAWECERVDREERDRV